MLAAFVFDEQHSERVDDWRAALARLHEGQLLWLAAPDPTDEEAAALQETLELEAEAAGRLREPPKAATLADVGERMHVTLYAVSGPAESPALVPVECVLGPNWIVTVYRDEVEVLGEFLERAEGGGQIGALDAPSFVAAIFEWVVASYLRAFEGIESELEELDARVMADAPNEIADELTRLVEIRRTIGRLRRALAPHREVAVSLSHPELDVLSTEESARRFSELEHRVTQALDAARDTKDSTIGSFDLLVTRIGQRTNDIMKVLTLVTVILLPATVLGGIMGMNFQVGFFDLTWIFWLVLAAMGGIAVAVLWTARARNWI